MCWLQQRYAWMFSILFIGMVPAAMAQSELQTRILVINGHSETVTIYRIHNQSFVDLETLARIGNGSVSFQGDQIILTLPSSSANSAPAHESAGDDGMTRAFMSSAIQNLRQIKDWTSAMAYGIQRGIPGDGSRIVVLHDRAAEGVRLAQVDAVNHSDQQAMQLLNNLFNQVDGWKRKLFDSRKTMSAANYSMTPDALDRDSDYQKIVSCGQFLATMLTGPHFQDNSSCH